MPRNALPRAVQTSRLLLEPWDESHTALLRRLALTPAVVRHIGDGTTWSEARIQDVARHNREHWREHGFGWRVARMRERVGRPAGAPIGLIALSYAGEGAGIDAREHEIGWWLAPDAWGRGLAREGAAAVRDEAFGRVGAPSVVARIAPPNAASLAVAAAIGLRHERYSTGRGGERIAVLRLSAGPPTAQAAGANRPLRR
ncbi:MAG: GNAT family N-acetyltransferase [Solirubrobacteraceae bacterium]